MVFPAAPGFTTENLDAGTDSPNAARADLFNALEDLGDIIESANQPGGVPTLTDAGLISLDQMPLIPNPVQVIPPSKGGTGCSSLEEFLEVLGLAGGMTFNVNAPVYFGDPANNNYFTFDGSAWRFFVGGVDVGGFGA